MNTTAVSEQQIMKQQQPILGKPPTYSAGVRYVFLNNKTQQYECQNNEYR
eukprot:m.60747 g.60747  ORF g.60747 m.60747 type:complete len:50 (-) comp11347_c0_seq3:32-181(-)